MIKKLATRWRENRLKSLLPRPWRTESLRLSGSSLRLIQKGWTPRATVVLVLTLNPHGRCCHARIALTNVPRAISWHTAVSTRTPDNNNSPQLKWWTPPVEVSIISLTRGNPDQPEGSKKENTEWQKQLIGHERHTSSGGHHRNRGKRWTFHYLLLGKCQSAAVAT